MTILFDAKERTRVAPKRPGENEYAFYDAANWPELEVYRQLLNGWVAELPPSEQGEMVTRLREGDSLEYQAALAELTVHAALIRQGYRMELHPPSGHPSRKPDFLVRTANDEPVAYVEVTTFGPAQEHVARSNLEASIYNAIDRASLPAGFRLLYDVVEYGKTLPKLSKLRSDVEKWSVVNAKDDVKPDDELPMYLIDDCGWKIELKLMGGFRKDRPTTRAIGGAMGDVRHVKADTEIREALQKKGSRYGVLNAPYVIVVADCKDELQGGDHNADALLSAVAGEVVTSVDMRSGQVEEHRKSNGYWWYGGKPAHEQVSAVLLLPKPHLWDLRKERWQPIMVWHPWANFPLPAGLLPVPGYQHQPGQDEGFRAVEGTSLADLLQLPHPWPPE